MSTIKKVLLRAPVSVPTMRPMSSDEWQLAADSFSGRSERKKAKKILNHLRTSLELLVDEGGRLGIRPRVLDERADRSDRSAEPIILPASLGEYLQYFLCITHDGERPRGAEKFLTEMPQKVRKLFDASRTRQLLEEAASVPATTASSSSSSSQHKKKKSEKKHWATIY